MLHLLVNIKIAFLNLPGASPGQPTASSCRQGRPRLVASAPLPFTCLPFSNVALHSEESHERKYISFGTNHERVGTFRFWVSPRRISLARRAANTLPVLLTKLLLTAPRLCGRATQSEKYIYANRVFAERRLDPLQNARALYAEQYGASTSSNRSTWRGCHHKPCTHTSIHTTGHSNFSCLV